MHVRDSSGIRMLVSFMFLCGLGHLFVQGYDKSEGQDVPMPSLGLGTAGLGKSTTSIVLKALDLGVKLIDTAQATEWYNEAAVGDALVEYEKEKGPDGLNDLMIVTKVHPRSYSYNDMNSELSNSIHNFPNHIVDAVLLHAPWCWEGMCTPEEESVGWRTGWRNLELLKDAYNINFIGVSNFDLAALQELVLQQANRKVSIIQNWMDPFHQDKEVRAFCKDHRIVYMAYSSFGTQWRGRDGNPVLNNDVLKSIAAGHNTTVTKVILAWLIQEGVVAIPRSGSLEHLQVSPTLRSIGIYTDVHS